MPAAECIQKSFLRKCATDIVLSFRQKGSGKGALLPRCRDRSRQAELEL